MGWSGPSTGRAAGCLLTCTTGAGVAVCFLKLMNVVGPVLATTGGVTSMASGISHPLPVRLAARTERPR
jgi:hypothetical protein